MQIRRQTLSCWSVLRRKDPWTGKDGEQLQLGSGCTWISLSPATPGRDFSVSSVSSGLFESFVAFSLYQHFGKYFSPPSFHDYQKSKPSTRDMYQFLAWISRNCARSYHSELHTRVSDYKAAEEPPLFLSITIVLFLLGSMMEINSDKHI